MIAISGCSPSTPKLDRPFLPQGYQIGSISPEEVVELAPSIYSIELTTQKSEIQKVIALWKKRAFHDAFQRIQPLSVIYREDISNIAIYLNRLFRIYLVAFDPDIAVSANQLRRIFENRFQCDPLSNLEIRFVMNTSLSIPFSNKPLTMLLISSHELALRKGAEPVYPDVYSPYLRKLHKLPSLRDPEEINLFATKNENGVYSATTNGFVICSKNPQ